MRSSSTRASLGTHDDRRESNQVYLTLAHHANQSVITDSYADREGIGEILGLGGPGNLGGYRRGFLPLLQMRLDYRIPLNLHLSGTLIEALAWRHPESFSLIKRLRHAGMLEMIGSVFSQSIMPFFSDEHNLRQINEELWLYRRHLDWDLGAVKTSWRDPCTYETSADSPKSKPENERRLAGWASALTSYARSCLVIAMAAEWFKQRDGAAHAELADIDEDGEEELVLKNNWLFAVFSPRRVGRLTYLFDLTGRSGRLMIGNISDDWNLQEDLNRYMDCPQNHPGALAEVGHEHDWYQGVISEAHGRVVNVSLRNIDTESPLRGAEKRIGLSAEAGHMCVNYLLPQGWWRLGAEICFSPDYHRLLQHGRDGPLAASTGG